MGIKSSIVLQTNQLTKQVNSGETALDILRGVHLSINLAESVAILGASGSGKTTLLSLLAGLDKPSSGEIYLFQHALHLLDEEARAKIRAQYVGFIFQSFQLLPRLTALENVLLPLELKGDYHRRDAAIDILQQVGLAKRLAHYPGQLSGGEQQRVAIARAFVIQPAILFADEITGNLDDRTGQQVIDLLFALNQERQTTLMMVTHDKLLAKQCAKRYLLQEGQLTISN